MEALLRLFYHLLRLLLFHFQLVQRLSFHQVILHDNGVNLSFEQQAFLKQEP
jgi:hypothetical protein